MSEQDGTHYCENTKTILLFPRNACSCSEPDPPEPTYRSGLTELNAQLQRALALCETLTPEEVEQRNERMREDLYDRRANT